MHIRSCMTAIGLLALAACGSPENKGDGKGSSGTSGGASGAQVRLEPGEWETTVETVNVNAPGMPPAVAAAMKKSRTTMRNCVTLEQANAPKTDMFGGKGNASCRQEGYSWSGGRIQGKTTCDEKGAGKMVMTVDGHYSPQNVDMTMTMNTEAQGQSMTVETHMTGRRVGACPAGKGG